MCYLNRLSATRDLKKTQEEINNVHIKIRSTHNRVIKGFAVLLWAREIKSDIECKNNNKYKVKSKVGQVIIGIYQEKDEL